MVDHHGMHKGESVDRRGSIIGMLRVATTYGSDGLDFGEPVFSFLIDNLKFGST